MTAAELLTADLAQAMVTLARVRSKSLPMGQRIAALLELEELLAHALQRINAVGDELGITAAALRGPTE